MNAPIIKPLISTTIEDHRKVRYYLYKLDSVFLLIFFWFINIKLRDPSVPINLVHILGYILSHQTRM